jgi:hypothetical protein
MGLLLLAVSGGLLLLIVLILALLFIPVAVHVAAGRVPGSAYASLQASWGCIGARARREGPVSRLEWLFLGRPFLSRPLESRETPVAEPVAGRTPAPMVSQARALLKLARPLCSLGKRFLSAVTFGEIRGHLRIGLRDPVDTGVLYGWYCALVPLLRGNRIELAVRPAFDREILEGEVRADFRIHRPLLLLLAAAGLFLDPDVRSALATLREGGGS